MVCAVSLVPREDRRCCDSVYESTERAANCSGPHRSITAGPIASSLFSPMRGITEMMQSCLLHLHAISLVACGVPKRSIPRSVRHQRDDATLSTPPMHAIYLWGLMDRTKEMTQPYLLHLCMPSLFGCAPGPSPPGRALPRSPPSGASRPPAPLTRQSFCCSPPLYH